MTQMIKVMIVDDSEEMRSAVRLLLSLSDRLEVVAEAENGEEALRRLEVVQPDIILMDMNMPVMGGVEATKRISASHPNISVIVLSIQDDAEYVRHSLRAGAKNYLCKPISAGDLEAAIVHIYESSRASA